MLILRRFFAYYKPYMGLFYLDFGCAVFAGVLELVFPMAVSYFIDNLLPSENWSVIVWACAGLMSIYVVNAGLNYIVTYWGHLLGVSIETDMRRKLFEHIQKLSFRYFDNTKTGTLIGRITTDLQDIGEVAHHGPEDLFIAVMTLVGAFILMGSINLQLTLMSFLVIPAILWVAIYFSGKMTRTFRSLFRSVGEFNARIEDAIGGIRVVKAFANEKHEESLFNFNNQQYKDTKMVAYKNMAGSSTLSYVLMRFVSIFIMLAGTWFVIQGWLTYGEFIAFLLLTNVFFRPLEKINAVIESYPKGIAGFRRYVEVIDTEPDEVDRPDAVAVQHLEGDIRFNNVTFGYDPARPIIRNFSLAVAPGETVAFVGPSGAGKTTISSLLPRFYDVDSGAITVDGIDVRDMTMESLRRQIGIVQQDVFLFAGTLRENIAYGKLEAPDEEIWDAARRAQMDEFIRTLPEGLDTIVGERGVKLSGGQKQRVAIARMFLKNPPILILDEATSALDTATELAIQQALNDLSVGRTTLVIAHRLATIKNADRIVVVTEKGIAEQGRHSELLKKSDGVYRNLHNAQYAVHVGN